MRYVIVGIGGQGILFSSRVLGEVAVRRGEPMIGSEVHGMAQRGGSVISHFKSGNYKSPLVMAGEADILLAFDQNEGIRNLQFLRQKGAFVVNVHDKSALENPSLAQFIREREISVHWLEGYSLLKEHMGGNFLFLNVLLMGAMCGAKVSDLTLEEVSRAVKELSPAKFEEANMKVFAVGADSVRS